MRFKVQTLNNISIKGLERLPRERFEVASEIGNPEWEQVITLVRPTTDGFAQEPVEPAVFVPLLGKHGFPGDPA